MLLYKIIAEELLCKSYAEDISLSEAYLTYANARIYLGRRFHIPKCYQAKVVKDMISYDLMRFVNKDVLCINLDKLNK